MHDTLLNVQEVAKQLKLNPRTVIRMAERGDLAAVKVAGRWRFRESDVETYLQFQTEDKHGHGVGQIDLQAIESDTGELQRATVKQRLELAKQQLELQKEKLDVKAQRIDVALEMVDMLPPEVNADKKTEFLQSLLENVLRQLDPA